MKVEHTDMTSRLDRRTCAHRSVRSRTGSALLIVIGTLALISVFAVVYLSIGRTDRRTANAVRSIKAQKSTSTNFGDYISSVLGDDRLDSVVQWDGVTAIPFGRREATDAPYTDWTRRSEAALGSESELFTPTGGMFSLNGLTQANDFSVASDPWLASTTPVFLGTPGVANTSRPFSSYIPFDAQNPNARNFLDNRDWLQISNLAPDGRFVNLFNLRPNPAFGDTNAVGSIDAQPGVGVSIIDRRRVRRMSEYLSLWEQDVAGDPESLVRTYYPADNSNAIWVPGQTVPFDIGLSDVFNVPAVWTMYQRFMFMPINQPFITLNHQGNVSTWADPDYPAYQYADADGDGMADSRWFELSAARDLAFGGSQNSREDIEVMYDNDSYRYFVAARVVDLSSLVNVNTATDLLVPPTAESPLGLTPADVDLRRLLTMQDAAHDYPGFGSSQRLSYAWLHRPYQRTGEPIWAGPSAQANFERNVTDYWNYQHLALDGRALLDTSSSMLIGRYAYDAIRQGVKLGSSLTNRYSGVDGVNPLTRQDLLQFERNPASTTPTDMFFSISPEQRVEQYRATAQLNPTNAGTAWARDSAYGSGLYGLEDLTEILTFHGLNDPDITSRFERVSDGRFESAAMGPDIDPQQTRRLGPMISNRPLSLDRDQHGLAMDTITDNPGTRPQIANQGFRRVNGRISFNSMAHFALTPRSKITMLSGFVPMVPSERVEDPSIFSPLTLDSTPGRGSSMSALISSSTGLFDLYTDVLVNELDANNNFWPSPVADFQTNQDSTLFYGHRGAELALRIAAHSAVNMKDMTDGDTDPTIATLIIDNNSGDPIRTYIDSAGFDPMGDSEYQLYAGVADGNVFDLDPMGTLPVDQRLANNNLPLKRQMVNVYGIEAMPVLTEVSVLYAFTDAPQSSGSASEDDFAGSVPSVGLNGLITYPFPDNVAHVRIDGAQSTTNDDYLIQVLAFQLHNPYDHSISLGGNGISQDAPLTRHRVHDDETVTELTSNYLFDYYIEYAGRFYKIAKYLEWYPTTNNGENYFAFDSSATTPAFNIATNPSDTIDPVTGGLMERGDQFSSGGGGQSVYSDFITRNVILGAGETRVFYVIADKRFDDLDPALTPGDDDGAGPDDRWTRSLKGWNQLPPRFRVPILNSNDHDNDGLPDGPADSRGWTGPAEQWVEHQLSIRSQGNNEPVMMMEFDPRNGYLLNEQLVGTTVEDPTIAALSPLFGATRNDVSEVRLWKKIVTKGEETTDPTIDGVSSPTARNLIENDLLVDRMSVPTMTLSLNGGAVVELADSVSYPENFPRTLGGVPIRNDNTGITIARWKTHRRGDWDPDITSTPTSSQVRRPSPGEITPWMLRSRGNPLLTTITHDVVLPETPDVSDIFEVVGTGLIGNPATEVEIKGDFEIQQTLRDFFDMSNAAGQEIVQTIATQPYLKSLVDGSASSGGPVLVEDDSGNDTAGKFPDYKLIVTDTVFQTAGSGVAAAEILVSGGNIADSPRLADLLLAWGIGPSFAPDPSDAARIADSTVYLEDEWMTGPEAMAIALGIDEDPDTGGTDIEGVSIWKDAFDTANTNEHPLFDDGHLVLDGFVSYLNTNFENPPIFTPGIGGDLSRGTGAPIALGVIDHARAISPIEQITDTNLTALELALTRPILGTINVNTAPIEVLRLLPGLSPSRAEYTDELSTAKREWWGKDYPDINLPDMSVASGSLDSLIENPDVAAAIVAYRDRTYGFPNTAARSEPIVFGSGTPTLYESAPLNFEPTDPLLFASNMLGEFPAVTLPATDFPVDRSTMTGIEGIRPTPGFGSLGELLAVRVDPEFKTGTALEIDRWEMVRHLSIQQYGNDDKAAGLEVQSDAAGDPMNISIMSQLFGYESAGSPGVAGSTVDDYAEKLSMANSVLNTLSVRSDYYAVWFVVQGYQESDVKNLRPEDPLIPSIKKRYLMVVDRSNVIEPGDKPKILVFKELPL